MSDAGSAGRQTAEADVTVRAPLSLAVRSSEYAPRGQSWPDLGTATGARPSGRFTVRQADGETLPRRTGKR